MDYSGQASQAYNQLQNFQKTMVDPSQLYQQAQQQYGVGDAYNNLKSAQQAVAQTNNLISQLPQQVSQTQAGTEMTAAQRGNLMQTEMQPLQQQYSSATNSANASEQAYQALLGQAATQANLGLQGQQLKSQNLQGLYGTATSGSVGMAQAGATVEAAKIAAAAQASQLQAMQGLFSQYLNKAQAAGAPPAAIAQTQSNLQKATSGGMNMAAALQPIMPYIGAAAGTIGSIGAMLGGGLESLGPLAALAL